MGNGLGVNVRGLTIFDGLALIVALGLAGVGFLIGTIGGGESGSTTSVELTVTPANQVRPLSPGGTTTFPVYINNPNDYGVRVDSISAGSSTATGGGCPAGIVTSAPVEGPTGFMRPTGIRTYDVSVTMAATVDDKCQGQSFTLPLTVTLASATADRGW
ncbi:MAG TPA: hypothetical protein VJT72_06720 [Pseudonocardiaceae bacterium]|nr:hypothetical protein [Pseudonocardiaceae bacterium]